MSDFFILRLQFVHFNIALSGMSGILHLQMPMKDFFISVAKIDPIMAVSVFSFGFRALAAPVDSWETVTSSHVSIAVDGTPFRYL